MSKIRPKVTIRDVAKAANVSAMTVTRVMRNDRQVAEATRQSVLAAVQALNYEPLQSARSLSSSFSRTIGLVVLPLQDNGANRSGYEYLAALHLGAFAKCSESGFGLLLARADTPESITMLVRSALAQNVGGYVVAAPATERPGLLDALKANDIPHALISPLDAGSSEAVVRGAEKVAMRDLVLHLGSAGHRDIAYVGSKSPSWARQERLAGYKAALRQLKLPMRKEWVVETGHNFADGVTAGRQLLKSSARPTAVQCANDELAVGVMSAAHEQGLQLPTDLSVAGFDDYGAAVKVWPPLSTIHLPVEDMAAFAVGQVIAMLEGRPVDSRTFECPLRLRRSVANINAAHSVE